MQHGKMYNWTAHTFRQFVHGVIVAKKLKVEGCKKADTQQWKSNWQNNREEKISWILGFWANPLSRNAWFIALANVDKSFVGQNQVFHFNQCSVMAVEYGCQPWREIIQGDMNTNENKTEKVNDYTSAAWDQQEVWFGY